MRIDCPHCSASYNLPPEKVPAGRSVRCVRCTQTWTPIPGERPVALPVAAPAAVMPEMPVAAQAPLQPHAPVAPPSLLQRIRLPVAWALTVAVLGAAGWAVVTRRAQIMQAWPPSERAYIVLGLAPHS